MLTCFFSLSLFVGIAHDLIGECSFTIEQLQREQQDNKTPTMQLIRTDKPDKIFGNLHVKAVLQPAFSLIQYVRGGLQISMSCCIDFTGSNGHYKDNASLHFMSNSPNQYQMAIEAVGAVLQPYNSSEMIGSYGFGARTPLDPDVSHCFPLSLNPAIPELHGVPGILSAYKAAIPNIAFSGPTNFATFFQLLNDCAERAHQNNLAHTKAVQQIQQGQPNVILPLQQYMIVFVIIYISLHEYLAIHFFASQYRLVLTDGAICDLDRTLQQVYRASPLPISFIIVGVGCQ